VGYGSRARKAALNGGEKKPRSLGSGFMIGVGSAAVLTRAGCSTPACLLALRDVETDALPFLERLEALALDCGEVREHVLAAAFRVMNRNPWIR